MERIDVNHLVDEIIKELLNPCNVEKISKGRSIPIGVSGRHCHLNKEAMVTLFGADVVLTKKMDLLQPDQFAANETVTIAGPKGSFINVRILGPLRKYPQIEVSQTDAIKLGLKPPIRESGKLAGSSSITIIGPKGSIYLEEGLIIAQAHIHMSHIHAEHFGLQDGDYVCVKMINEMRPISFEEVKVRVSQKYVLEMHIDTDEANAANVKSGSMGELIKIGERLC